MARRLDLLDLVEAAGSEQLVSTGTSASLDTTSTPRSANQSATARRRSAVLAGGSPAGTGPRAM